jgi:8-amino-3,8-dideoxy-alpha-D-manno-octulosonate transaminase
MPGYELIGSEEKKALTKLIDDGGILFAHGFDKIRKNYHVREFEKQISIKFKSKYCLAVSSGTSAIKIALKALGVKPGDEVITQAFNFIATIEAIIDCGAKPILVNVDKSLNMCPIELKKKISKKTKVIVPVHMLGVSCDNDKIFRIAKQNKIKILEDNCESIGGRYKKKFLGTVGDIGVFSLDFGKFITTGEGGIVLTNNKKYHKYMMEYHDHGHENNPKLSRGEDTKTIPGFNYRMTELQAVVGKVQLKKVNYILQQNFKRYQILKKYLSKYFDLRKVPINSIPNYDTFIFYVNKNEKRKVLKLINDSKFGTKNLPDAIKWHCSYYWDHVFNKKDIEGSIKTMKILKMSIALPILLKKSLKEYEVLAKNILRVKKD